MIFGDDSPAPAPFQDAIAGWIQVLALTFRGIDQLPLEDRGTLSALSVFDGHFREIRHNLETDEARVEIDHLKAGLQHVLNQLGIYP